SGKLASEDRPHQLRVILADCGQDVLKENPLRPMHQKPRERQTLLLARRQNAIPSFLAVEAADKPRKSHPLERGVNGGIIETTGLSRIGYDTAQHPERQIGTRR